MCGRFASARKRQELLEEFGVQRDRVEEDLRPDYNVAPTKPIYAVLARKPKPAMRNRPTALPTAAKRYANCACCAGAWCRPGPRTSRSAAG